LNQAALTINAELPMRPICEALGTSRSTLSRRKNRVVPPTIAHSYHRKNALTETERARVLETLNSDRFADLAPPQIFAQLLDQGVYLCSISTMYRILRANAQVLERRRIARHPEYQKPELLATAPRQVLSWDITKLRGPEKGVWYSLLVMIDIFSRYVVGWMLVRRANADIAKQFIGDVIARERIGPGEAVIHADRESEMTAQPVCALLDSLSVAQSHSRPHVSNDNPYSESINKTLKYSPRFPNRSVRSKTAKCFAKSSSIGTTTNIGIRESGC